QVGMPGEHQVDCADDVVQEIGLICGVAVGAGEDHPIGAAGREHIHRSRPEVRKQTAPGATVSRRLAVQHTLVDRLMVAGLDGPIELRVALRLEGLYRRQRWWGNTAVRLGAPGNRGLAMSWAYLSSRERPARSPGPRPGGDARGP